MLDTEMLIGAKFVAGDRRAGGRCSIPRPRRRSSTCPKPRFAQVDAAVAAAEKAFETWSRTTPAERSALLLKLADASSASRSLRRSRSAELRQAEQSRAAGRDAGDRRLLPLLRRRGAHHARRCRGRIHGRPHLDDPPRSHRRRRLDRAVELSADDGGMEARAGARGRQHGRLQAVGADAADDAEARARSSPRSCRKAWSMSWSGAARPSATR